MGTDVSIVMCYREFGDRWRQRSYDYTRPWYEAVAAARGWPFVLDTSEGGHAKAINAGVRAAAGDIIVLVDSDSLVPPDRLEQAVEMARAPGLVVPHDRYVYLDQSGTFELVTGMREPFDVNGAGLEFAGHGGVGNVIVFSRETWQTVGGFDERFYAWGGDDTAFYFCCEAFCGPTRRLTGDVIHLWHPRNNAAAGIRPPDIEAVLMAYEAAAKQGHEAVRAYVAAR